MNHFIHQRLVSCVILCTLFMTITPAMAQQNSSGGTQEQFGGGESDSTERLQLTVGDILEILPSSDIQNAAYSWILTQDRTFIQAGRTETFRYRFLQPATYTLIAEIQSPDGSARITRTFTIAAKAHDRGVVTNSASSPAPIGGSGTLTGLVMIDPPMDSNKRDILPVNRQLVKFTPISPDVKPLSLDIDTSKDSDNDGISSNDVDNKGTFFQLYAEPLYVWLASPITSRKMSVTTVGADGAARVQDIEIVTIDYAQQQGLIVSPIHFTSEQPTNGTFAFTPQFDSGEAPSTALLYQWSFGDKEESLLQNPTHTFAADGTYTVTLKVRNLVNGQDVARDEKQITVAGVSVASASAASTNSAASSAAPVVTEEGNGFSILSILPYVGIFVLFVILGLGITILLSKFKRGRSIDQTFADMEKSVLNKDAVNAKNPPMLAIPATAKATAAPAAVEEKISKREEDAASSAPVATTPRIDEKAAPSWLKKGLDVKPTVPTPTVATPAATAPVTASTPASAQPATPIATAATAPSWLQTSPKPLTPVTTPAATPAAPAAPAVPTAQKAPVTPAEITTPKPQPAATATPSASPSTPAAAVPAWLQKPANTPATQAATTPAAPIIAKPATPTVPTPVTPQVTQSPAIPAKPATPALVAALPIVKPTPAAQAAPVQTTVTPKPAVPVVAAPQTQPSVAAVQTPQANSVAVQTPKPTPTPAPASKPVVPVITPVVPSTTPIQQPVKPVATPTPVPATPVTQPVATIPSATTTVAPAATPAVQVSKPVNAPVTVAPKQIQTPAAPVNPLPKPVEVQKPVEPAAPKTSPMPASTPTADVDKPIAIIRADSLEKPKDLTGNQGTPV